MLRGRTPKCLRPRLHLSRVMDAGNCFANTLLQVLEMPRIWQARGDSCTSATITVCHGHQSPALLIADSHLECEGLWLGCRHVAPLMPSRFLEPRILLPRSGCSQPWTNLNIWLSRPEDVQAVSRRLLLTDILTTLVFERLPQEARRLREIPGRSNVTVGVIEHSRVF